MPEPYYSVFTSSLWVYCVPFVWESKNLSELERAIGLWVRVWRVFLVCVLVCGPFRRVFLCLGGSFGGTEGVVWGTGGAEKVTGQSGLPHKPKLQIFTGKNSKSRNSIAKSCFTNALYVHQKSAVQIFEQLEQDGNYVWKVYSLLQ